MKKDPDEVRRGDSRIRRGGSEGFVGYCERVAHRHWSVPGHRCIDLGLRLARTAEPVSIERSLDEKGS